VDIGHRDGGALDSRQAGHVRDLLQTLVVLDVRDQLIIGEHQPMGDHRACAWHAPAMIVDPL
jgi:hypothetical protein